MSSAVRAQAHIALPPVNLGGSSFMDGLGGPGLLLREALGAFDARRFNDADGNRVPGNTRLLALSAATLVAFMPPFKFLGGYWGVEVLVPVVYANVETAGGNATAVGIGDLTFSAFVWQLPTLTLLKGHVFQRLDFDIVAPTGAYDANASVDIGSNVWSVNPYYAVTWELTDRLETSWRFHYLWNSSNDAPSPAYGATSIQPGQAIHFNGAASFAVTRAFRVGLAGYFLRQITDSRASDRAVARSAEQVVGLGPGFLATIGKVQLGLNAYSEFAVVNRPQGTRVNAVAMAVW